MSFSKKFKILALLPLILLCQNNIVYGAGVGLGVFGVVESEAVPGTPFGTVWVEKLDKSVQEYHTGLALKEQEAPIKLNAKGRPIHRNNISLFGLRIKLKGKEPQTILDHTAVTKDFWYVDRDYYPDTLTHLYGFNMPPLRPGQLETLKKIYPDEYVPSSYLGNLAYTSFGRQYDWHWKEFKRRSGLEITVTDPESVYRRINELKAKIKAERLLYGDRGYIEDSLANIGREEYYTHAIYTDEKAIARVVSHYLANASLDMSSFKFNGLDFPRDEIEHITLNIHTRKDMSPVNSMLFAQSGFGWKEKLQDIPFATIVTSREEYIYDYKFIADDKYYRGLSQRAFGWNYRHLGASLSDIFTIASEGLVIQHALAQ